MKALGVNNLENAYLLKEYFLPYSSCIYCSKKYSDLNIAPVQLDTDIVLNAAEMCTGHHEHVFGNFFIEKHMIPIIMQQFLIDMGIRTKSSSQKVAKHFEDFDRLDDGHTNIDVNEIEEFWNDYVAIIPNDLELIWDTIDNGLIRYLQVIFKKNGKIQIQFIDFYSFEFALPFNRNQILKKRKHLNDECNFLRQQNAEITHLLQQYAKDDLLKYTNN